LNFVVKIVEDIREAFVQSAFVRRTFASGIRSYGTFCPSKKTAQFFTPAFFHFSIKINTFNDFDFLKNP
jgi:hypothetical protein